MAKISLMFLLSLIREPPNNVPSHKLQQSHSYHWSYEGLDGPSSWPRHYKHCGGRRQSPINIDTRHVEYDESLSDFDFSQFDISTSRPSVFNITHNGHSASASVNDDMYCSMGGLSGKYKTSEFHFHWGSDDARGSEHGIDGHNYPLEMHVVHYAVKYGTINEAKTKPNGLAVLGVMFEISEKDNPDFQPIIHALKNIKREGDRDSITNLHIGNLLPEETSYFYRYKGSLTTPPCYESVIWTVFAVPQKVSSRQIAVLRSLILGENDDIAAKHESYEGHGRKTHPQPNSQTNVIKYMVDNYRPFQDIHGRIVKKSFHSLQHAASRLRSEVKYFGDVSTELPKAGVLDLPINILHQPKIFSEIPGNMPNIQLHTRHQSKHNTLSGANTFQDNVMDVINTAHDDEKASATQTRIALTEQFTGMKLNSADSTILNSKDYYQVLNISNSRTSNETPLAMIMPPLTTIQPETTAEPLTTTIPATTTTTQSFTTTTQNVTSKASPLFTTIPGAVPRRSEPTTIGRVGQIKPNAPDTAIVVQRITELYNPIPPAHEAGRGFINPFAHHSSNPTQSRALPSWLPQIYVPKYYGASSHHDKPLGSIQVNPISLSVHQTPDQTYASHPNSYVDSTARNMNRNPFKPPVNHRMLVNSQYIPNIKRRQHVPDPPTKQQTPYWSLPWNRIDPSQSTNPFLLNQNVQRGPRTHSPMYPKKIPQIPQLPYQPQPRSRHHVYGNYQSVRPVGDPRYMSESQRKLAIDRSVLLKALRRIDELSGIGYPPIQTTTRKPEENPYILLHASRIPVRVSNKFARGMYEPGNGPGFSPLGSAIRTLGIGAIRQMR